MTDLQSFNTYIMATWGENPTKTMYVAIQKYQCFKEQSAPNTSLKFYFSDSS